MKKVFVLIVVPALLVAMGFAQTPAASGNTDQVNIRGCLGGSDGNYTVAEDNTGKIFKITTSGADLKAFVGQDVNLIGHKAGTAENNLAVTEFNMISEHCAASAAAPATTISTTPDTISAPPAAAAAPATSAPATTISTTPDAISTPPAAAAAPAAAVPATTVITPVETASAPPAAAVVHPTRPSPRPQKPAATPSAAAAPAEPVSTPVADEVVPVAPVGPSSETASVPAAPAAAAPRTSTSRSAAMLVSIVVVLLIGAGVPLYNRWRRRKLAEQTKGENLSFTNEAKSDSGKTDTTGGRKAA